MRRCPYCAEEIQDAAIVCRFCGRDVKPGARSETRAESATSRVNLPSQRWYRVDERIKSARRSTRERPPLPPQPKTSMWSKLGGLAADVFDLRARPSRTAARKRIARRYPTLRAYQRDVARLVKAGWLIERQVDEDDGAIRVTWTREQ